MRKIFALPLILFVFACTTPAQDGLIACNAYDGALRALAGYRQAGKLSEQDIATVDRWRPVLNEACSQPITSETLSVIEQGLFAMIEIQEDAR